MKLPDEPLSRKWLINLTYSWVRGYLDVGEDDRLSAQLHAYLGAHPEDAALRDELLMLILWEMARTSAFHQWLRRKDATTIEDLANRLAALEADRA